MLRVKKHFRYSIEGEPDFRAVWMRGCKRACRDWMLSGVPITPAKCRGGAGGTAGLAMLDATYDGL